MLVLVEQGLLDEASAIDVELVAFLTRSDKSNSEVRAFVTDLLAAYESLQGKLAAGIASTKSELVSASKRKSSVTAYHKASRY